MINLKSERLLRAVLNALESKEEFSLKLEEQNSDYEGAIFQLSHHIYRMRLAKLTPKKKGYFVAVWEKDSTGVNQAYRYENSPETLIISIIAGEKCGQFIFPKSALLTYGILKNATQKGKMAFRVYPSWVVNLNATAKKTQAWQINYFVDLSPGFAVEKLTEIYFK